MVPSNEEGVGLVHWRAAATAVALPKPAVGICTGGFGLSGPPVARLPMGTVARCGGVAPI